MEKSVSFILARENHNDKLAQEFRRRKISINIYFKQQEGLLKPDFVRYTLRHFLKTLEKEKVTKQKLP